MWHWNVMKRAQRYVLEILYSMVYEFHICSGDKYKNIKFIAHFNLDGWVMASWMIPLVYIMDVLLARVPYSRICHCTSRIRMNSSYTVCLHSRPMIDFFKYSYGNQIDVYVNGAILRLHDASTMITRHVYMFLSYENMTVTYRPAIGKMATLVSVGR